MKKWNLMKSSLYLFFSIGIIGGFIYGCSDESSIKTAPPEQFRLGNGMQVVLKENHASPMITSLIFVNAGSKYETKYNNGVTHFLEHLLFDGTASRTQEEISEGIERLGGYINAFTRKEFTAYLVLMPREYFDFGLATQADMLFNSNFPDDRFPKERKIVIEEIKQGDDAEGASAESFFEEKALAGTPYARPIIGYESTIANIPREAVIDYYKKFYSPGNMIALIIGDFDKKEMKQSLQLVFGQFPEIDLPPAPQIDYMPLAGMKVFRTAANTKSTYINYSIEAPQYLKPGYFAFTLLEDYLSDSENSPLVKALKYGPNPMATSVSAYLDTKQEFSRLNIEIITEQPELADSIVTVTDMVLEGLSKNPPSKGLLDGYKLTRRCDEIYMSEKLHYYGFVKAPLMAITGWEFFENLQDNLDATSFEDITAACTEYTDHLNYIATITYPDESFADKLYSSAGPTFNEVTEYFKSQKYPEYDLAAGEDFVMPEIKHAVKSEEKYTLYEEKTFPNGLKVIVKSNPDSRVFALNVIGKNRSATEPEGKDGITDFVNRMIEKGTETYNAEQLARKLSSIGANVTLYDNPWIPFDDRYTTRQYSFMKFETIDDFTADGIKLFCEMIAHPAFDSVEAEKVRSEIFGLLGRDGGSTYKSARDEYYAALFKGTPYAKSIDGNYRTIGSITVEDLREHHKRIYAPENMIVTVGTNGDPGIILDMLGEELDKIPSTGFTPVEPTLPGNISGVVKAHEKMDKEQVYIYMGNILPSALSPDVAAIKVASDVLSNRLHESIREKQGLAYRVGASAVMDKKFGWFLCSMGTSAKNFDLAKNAILKEINRLKSEPPTEEELVMAINSLWGSYLTANLSRINQAFYMGAYEYLGLGYNWGDFYVDAIHSVTAEQVAEVARKYFDTENYVIATAGDI